MNMKTERLYKNKEWLRSKYWDEELSLYKIGKFCKVDHRKIWYWMKKFNIHRRSFIPNDIRYRNKNWLYEKYIKEELSTTQIAKLCKITDVIVGQWLKRFNISCRSLGESVYLSKANHCQLSKKAINWMEGELLGDACIFSGSPYTAFFSYSSQYQEYIDYVINTLQSFGIRCGKVQKRYHKKSNTYSYSFHSYTYKELLDIRKHWYPKGIKIVPRNIKLNSLMVRQWHTGDGCLKHHKEGRPNIELNTCGFSISDVEWLVKQLNKLGFKAMRWAFHNTIGISTKSTKAFLNYIGSSPTKCYNYKFDY